PQSNVAIPRETSATSACRGADQGAYSRALSAAGNSSDRLTASGAATNHGSSSFAFADGSYGVRGSLDFIVFFADRDRSQFHRENCAAFESPAWLGVLHNASCMRALRDGNPAIDFHGSLHGCRKRLAHGAGFRSKRLI